MEPQRLALSSEKCREAVDSSGVSESNALLEGIFDRRGWGKSGNRQPAIFASQI